ncbi:MAG: transcription antitermination protein NusB [Bacteroidales bacterium]|jgi:N utilization substance protein B|nr:transcription antitermination protein NusB [Bacteroidales bacterium]
MISRRFIRIKVMQAIYSHQMRSDEYLFEGKKRLQASFEDTYSLFVKMLGIFGAMTFQAQQIIDTNKQKLLPTKEDLQPNLKFVNNLFIKKLEHNEDLQKKLRSKGMAWNNDLDVLFAKSVYKQLTKTPLYQDYMAKYELAYNTFKDDKSFIFNVTEQFFLENEEIAAYFGEKKINWYLDYNDVILLIHRYLQEVHKNTPDSTPLPNLFKPVEDGLLDDKQFAYDLFMLAIENDAQFQSIIADTVQHWDVERLATLDVILLKMAMCEFCKFPSVPIKVTFFEYLELSKYYSTPKSRGFINGVLDKILEKLKEEGKINKTGRGLIE